MIGSAGRGGLEHDIGQRLGPRRHDEEAAEREGGACRHRAGEAQRRETEPLRLRREGGAASGPSPTMVALTPRPLARKLRERIEQHVDALEQTQLADEDEIGRIGLRRDRRRIRPP